MKSKQNDMDVDEGSKGSNMDMDSFMKNDIMDINLEDHMDVDNESVVNRPINGLEVIEHTASSKLKVSTNEVHQLSHENDLSIVFEGGQASLVFDKQNNSLNDKADSESALKEKEKDEVVILNPENTLQVKDSAVENNENIKIVNLDEDLIKFNDTIEGGQSIVPGSCNNESDKSEKEAYHTISSVNLNTSRDDSRPCVLTNSEIADFLSADFNEDDNKIETQVTETFKKTSVPDNNEKQLTNLGSGVVVEGKKSAKCEVSLEEKKDQSNNESLKKLNESVPDSNNLENVSSINLNKPSDQKVNEKELLGSQVEGNAEADGNKEKLLKNDGSLNDQSSSQNQSFSQLVKNRFQTMFKESNTQSDLHIKKAKGLMEMDKCQKNCGEGMEISFEENFEIEMSGSNENLHHFGKDKNPKDAETANVSSFTAELDNLSNATSETETADDSERQSDLESASESYKKMSKNDLNRIKNLDRDLSQANILRGSQFESGDSNTIEKTSVNELEEIHLDEEKTATDPLTDIEFREEINQESGDSEINNVPFGIVATTTIAPNEFENLVSASDVNGDHFTEENNVSTDQLNEEDVTEDHLTVENNINSDEFNEEVNISADHFTEENNEIADEFSEENNVTDDQLTEENNDLNRSHDKIPVLADLAMKIVLENEEKGNSATPELNNVKKEPIKIQTIKQEKLDFNFEHGNDEFGNQNVNLSTQPSRSDDEKKKSRKKKGKSSRKARSKKSKEKNKEENEEKNFNLDEFKGTMEEAVEHLKRLKKRNSRVSDTEKMLKLLQINMNDTPKAKTETSTSMKRKFTRSSLKLTTDFSDTSPSRKRTRSSLPDSRTEKRPLRSTVEITPKIDSVIAKKEVESKPPAVKRRNVALKSTTPRVQFKKDFKIVDKKFRNVARKRGQPYFKKRSGSEQEPAPIFVDTNFGGQDIDMFINENDDDDDSVNFYDNKDKLGHFAKIRKCKVVIKRMGVLEKLLPVKKSEDKIEPNICELCEPKRAFLSKSSLADHIKNEHINQSSGTSISPSVKSEVRVPSDMSACNVCQKLFHSKNRLAAHMKTCKLDESNKIITQVPGIDLSNLGKNVTISISTPDKKDEDDKTNVKANGMRYVCEICNRRFLMATGLRSHMRTHKNVEKIKSSLPKPGKLNLMCNICDKSFQVCSDLVEHISFHSLTIEKEKDILFTNMKKISNIQINLESVFETESSESETDNLTDDDDDDSSDYSYKVKINSTPKVYSPPNKCFECGRVFTIKAVYERHVGLISKISNLKDQTKCPVCDLEMRFRCKLGAHLETHKPQTEEQLICKKCNKTFRCENNLIRHELEHEGKLKVNCQYCSYSFHSMSDLYAHQEECKFKCSEYKCNLCKRVFTAKWRLDLHMKTDEKHGTDPQQPNTYFCDQCGREFKHLSVLKRHVDSRCGTEPLFECPDCDKKYFSQGSLASHKRTQHSTEKNFMCQYCSKDFFTKHQLHRHELRHNPDIRPYRCKYPNCDKTYRQPDSLRAHECEHTGLYPYVCEFCGLQFSNVKSLKLHRKSSNHWSDVEPNKVVTQACRQKHSGKNLGRKFLEGKQISEEEEIDPESHEDEPKNLVINESQYDGVYNERIGMPQNVPQYSNLQPFTVNHLIQSQQSSVLVQSAHPLATYTQAIENYFVIASQQEPMAGAHHHPMMN